MEDFFSNKYTNLSSSLSKAHYLFHVFQRTPKLYFETITIGGIVLFCYYLLTINTNLNVIVATLGIVVVASLRLMPSANRCLNAYNGLKYASPSIDLIFEEIKIKKYNTAKNNSDSKIQFNKNIKLDKINFKFANRNNFIFKEANLEILKGEKIAIIGDSGSGKSTLLDLIMGFQYPQSGKIFIDNNHIELNSKNWKRFIGYVPQSIYLFDDTILENIALGIDEKDLDKNYLKQCIEISELDDLIKSLPKGLKSVVGERGLKISGGQKQRIGIARALFKKAPIIILDEATNALDKNTEEKLVNNIINKLKNTTILMATHKLNLVKNFDKTIKIQNGKIEIL